MAEAPAGPPIMACAVCARVLTTVGDSGGMYRFEHDPLDLVGEDHPVVPVERDQMLTISRCDFCTADDPPPVWLLPARPFSVGDPSAYSVEPWAACEDCAALVRRDQWTRLRARCVQIRTSTETGLHLVDVDAAMGKLLRELHRNVTGSLVRINRPAG